MAMNQFLTSVKKKPLIAEKAKMYEFIGMEIYDLYESGQLQIDAILPFCHKIAGINQELAALENTEIQNGLICECGAKLHEDMNYCMACGKKVALEELIAQEPETKTYTECVCGAVVEVGTPMCMECGRRITI